MTPNQRRTLAAVVRATAAGRAYRASSCGERVTLASLFARGLLERRAWRGLEGERDAAHEYQAAAVFMDAIRAAGLLGDASMMSHREREKTP